MISGQLNRDQFKANHVLPENLGIRYDSDLYPESENQETYTNLLCKKRIKRNINHKKRMERFKEQDNQQIKNATDKLINEMYGPEIKPQTKKLRISPEKSNPKLNYLLNDGETKTQKLFINPLSCYRKKTEANTIPKKERQVVGCFESPKPYKHGIDLDSFGTDRKKIMAELKTKKDLYKDNDTIIESLLKLKDQNEFKKAFPKMISHNPPQVRYYKNDEHSKITSSGYSRNEYGRPYFS